MIQALRGMKDLDNIDAKKFEYFIKVASDIAKKAHFSFIQTPILEEVKLFKRSVGNSSDIVNKEMYDFTDKGENHICLRPEATASVVRSFIEKKYDKKGGIFRHFYYGPMFRYERPQKGRFRQFHQFGCESFGVDSVYEDVLIISIISDIFKTLNIPTQLEINSLGCSECMSEYKKTLVEKLHNISEQLCEDCSIRIKTNPLRVFDCKVDKCKQLLQNVPTITSSICKSCDDDFTTLQNCLKDINIDFVINSNLVRGLDYYNKTAFEFTCTKVGSQNAIAGGGRYDLLVQMLDGKATPAIGFAIGIDRILDMIEIEDKRDGYYIGAMDEEALPLAIKYGFKKQKQTKTYIQFDTKKLKNHLKMADKVNARYCAIIGEDELQKQSIWVKDLIEKKESIIKLDEF